MNRAVIVRCVPSLIVNFALAKRSALTCCLCGDIGQSCSSLCDPVGYVQGCTNKKAARLLNREARIEWRRHVLERLAERFIAQSVVLDVLRSGETIEEYGHDKPFHSALFLGYYQDKPYHVVAAYDEGNEKVYVITAYEPSLEAFEPDYRTRRKQ